MRDRLPQTLADRGVMSTSEQAGQTRSPEADTSRLPVGQALRAQREQLGWSLPDVAAWLRIRLSYLEALESGQVGKLPGKRLRAGLPARLCRRARPRSGRHVASLPRRNQGREPQARAVVSGPGAGARRAGGRDRAAGRAGGGGRLCRLVRVHRARASAGPRGAPGARRRCCPMPAPRRPRRRRSRR